MPSNFPLSPSSHNPTFPMGAGATGIGPSSGSGPVPSMEKTFITMHDLTSEARIVYASDSVADVLGYPPEEVIGLSCFDFFHPDELPFARKIHNRGIHLDRAAVLVYCRVKHKNGGFIHCETIFSVVYDVFVAATTLHVQTSKSQGRALTAPVIRRVFSSSPNDPRYHMLTHLSAKFHMGNPDDQGTHEPRVALILNRFTRTLTVLYASHASSSIFGVTPSQLTGKSFFECIHEDCLQEAVDALERAKENDSIAYLRFQWRDPINGTAEEAQTHEHTAVDRPLRRSRRISSKCKRKLGADDQNEIGGSSSRSSKRRAVGSRGEDTPAQQGESSRSRSSVRDASLPAAEAPIGSGVGGDTVSDVVAMPTIPREVEAVVSCTSDGLVVILRQARPLIPKPLHNVPSGIFASPWAPISLVPRIEHLPDKNREASLMEAIQEVAVFAWSLRQLGGEIISSTGSEKATTASKSNEGDNDQKNYDNNNGTGDGGFTSGNADEGGVVPSGSKAQQKKAVVVEPEVVGRFSKKERVSQGRPKANTRKLPRS
ncbi:hypothetical protein TWF569_005042 [Orbilia oligospora]|uniref:PAS domain-containing protein n=1 Tax=Orbilia oligospora TaxID=2813651 RepID=A0A7C8N9W7_ORBOL|nr:hypothetical protein TWF102_007840 [Orbilia oligospora]KAF3123792.1 hypothetical protein TWF703_000633 [Orbilia oligospora]KAF3125368.1 hypothetical protein TWF594_001622 [Orbilia oligospora]KAF3149404.1 hypothetical protein TWF569_005042 [Orbilia oligospora]